MKTLIWALPILWLVSCGESQNSQTKWGHLHSGLSPDAPQFLINKAPSETYRMCVPTYLSELYPGIESELEASVNIWGQSIGRQVTTEIKRVEAERPKTRQSDDSLRNKLYDLCGSDMDLVVGLAPYGGGTMGTTGSSWMSRGNQVVSFKRHLFLRDFSLSPHPYSNDWISLEQLEGKSRSSEEIIKMAQEDIRVLLDPEDKALTFPVVLHEVGHIWGLCDQYESSQSNCDPYHSSEHMDHNSTMGASKRISKLYLSKDDLMGIRYLARRDGFNRHWPETAALIKEEPSFIEDELIFFQLNEIKRESGAAVLNFSLVTLSQGGQLKIQYESYGAWKTMSSIPSREAFNIPSYTFTANGAQSLEFRLVLELEGDKSTIIRSEK